MASQVVTDVSRLGMEHTLACCKMPGVFRFKNACLVLELSSEIHSCRCSSPLAEKLSPLKIPRMSLPWLTCILSLQVVGAAWMQESPLLAWYFFDILTSCMCYDMCCRSQNGSSEISMCFPSFSHDFHSCNWTTHATQAWFDWLFAPADLKFLAWWPLANNTTFGRSTWKLRF